MDAFIFVSVIFSHSLNLIFIFQINVNNKSKDTTNQFKLQPELNQVEFCFNTEQNNYLSDAYMTQKTTVLWSFNFSILGTLVLYWKTIMKKVC